MWLWSKTAANNATADPTINWREQQSAGSINDSARALMASAAKWRDDNAGLLQLSGTSSAYTVSTNQGFTSLVDGQTLTVRPNVTNGAAPTLNVDTLGNIPIRAVTGTALAAGVMIAGTPYRLTYVASSNEFFLNNLFGDPNAPYLIPIGGFLDYSSTTPPNSNFILPYGQAISRTTYAAYFALVGTTFGTGDGTTTFNVPDLRGYIVAALDNMGGSAAGRITTAGSSIDGTTLGAHGGAQNVTLARANLPNVAPTATVTDPGHTHTDTKKYYGGANLGSGVSKPLVDATSNVQTGDQQTPTTSSSSTTGITVAVQSLNGGVTQTVVNKMPPTIMLPKLLRVI